MVKNDVTMTEVRLMMEIWLEYCVHFICFDLLDGSSAVREAAEWNTHLLYQLECFDCSGNNVFASNKHSIDICNDKG